MKLPLNASSRIMYQEAIKRGINCTLFGDNETILMEKEGKQWYIRGSRTSYQSSIGKTIADKKNLTKKVFEHFNLPTARSVSVFKEQDLSLLETLVFPVVMKPLDGRHGKGVVVGIENVISARDIFKKAEGGVLFEEMLKGTEYRVVCVDFKFVAAAFRKPAFVVGDGTSTIIELISIKNQHPWRQKGHEGNLSLIEIDNSLEQNLKEQDLSLNSVIEPGKEVFLRKTANLSTGGEAWDVTDTVCPENKKLFEAIARVCDLNTIGIDIMCTSLESPIVTQTQAGVIEVNASPGLRMHHYPISGSPRNVASLILDMVEQKGSNS